DIRQPGRDVRYKSVVGSQHVEPWRGEFERMAQAGALWLDAQRARLKPGVVKKLIGQSLQPVCLAADGFNKVTLCGCVPGDVGREQRAGVALDGREGHPQLV